MASNGRRKTDTVQYKVIMGVMTFIFSTTIGGLSFFLGQMAKANEAGFKQGVQNTKIIQNEEHLKTLNDKVKQNGKAMIRLKNDIHKIDKNVVEIGTKIDLLIGQKKSELEKKTLIAEIRD